MKIGSTRLILGATAMTAAWLMSAVLAAGQAGAQPKPPMSEEAFKNVRVLRGIPVDEFMGTMGVFSAALGISCGDCHTESDTSWENYALDTSPRKVMARRMVQMVTALNAASFGGRQVVTCYTCHRGSSRPAVTASLARVYGNPPTEETDDIIQQAAGVPSADSVLDKYVQAIGGAQRLAGVTSFVARGTSVGYGPESTNRPIEIFAKAPDQRAMIIHTIDGDNTRTYDGRAGWSAAPHQPVPVLPLAGSELAGIRLDAELSFPARIKSALRDWRTGFQTEIDDRTVDVVQGTSAGGVLATFYFDRGTGLLTRMVRYADSRVGRLPTQFDFADYRDVSGVKMPYRWKMSWLDGLENVELTDVRVNVAVDATKFAKPAAPAGK